MTSVSHPAVSAFRWTEPKNINTRNGPRLLRTAPLYPDHPAWKAWRFDKERMKQARFGVGKEYGGDGWVVSHWGERGDQFAIDFDVVLSLIDAASEDDIRSKEAQRIDFVPEDVSPLTTEASTKLFDWQRPSCQRIVSALTKGNALDASQTGAGKTFVALAACAELGLTPYVIAPLAVLESWRRASAFMGVPLGDVTNYDKARAGSSCGFIRKDPEADRRKDERTFRFSPANGFGFETLRPVLIFDEVQKCKNATSLQGYLLQDCAYQGIKILCLSATAAKDPTEMCGLGLAIGLHKGGEHYREWAQKHGCKKGTKGLFFTDNTRAAADIISRIHSVIFPARGTRIRSSDVPNYPENMVSAHLIENKEIVAAYGAMTDALEAIESKRASKEVDSREAKAMGLAEITKARRASEFGKVEFIIDETKELVADGFQVAIFLNFREHLALCRSGLKLGSEPVWGTAWLGKREVMEPYGPRFEDIDGAQQKPHERQQIIDNFQNGKQRVILVSLMAGGAGISLHDANGIAPRQSLISPSYSAIDLVQAVGRIWRAGSHSKATQRIIYAAGTIEEEIAASVTAKIANIETLNDGDVLPDCLSRFTSIDE